MSKLRILHPGKHDAATWTSPLQAQISQPCHGKRASN
jgi:hypothetical protein